jgi:hypothetical protein
MKHEAAAVALTWIPSEAIGGLTRKPFDAGITHYDPPPPDHIGPLGSGVDELRKGDRFRGANVLRAWAEVDGTGVIVGAGYSGGGVIGSTTVRAPGLEHTFEAVALPDIQHPAQIAADGTSARFVQTCGGRTGLPAPRRVRRKPFVQWQAPLAWTTVALTINADGTSKCELTSASRFPRHWLYDSDGQLIAKSGLVDFKDWYRKSFGRHSPWGDEDSPAFVTAIETALERTFSQQIMRGGAKPKVRKLKEGATLVRESERGTELFLLLDGVLRAEKDGERLEEYGPGALLGERAALEGGMRTATLVAVTKCKVAVASAAEIDHAALVELSGGHRHEDNEQLI